VSASTLEPPSLPGYQLRLPSFEGPFDVLLRLVERNQMPITDVSLVAVTEQFLAYVEKLGGTEPETVAEFASVGARLVLLKSRSLLPRPTISDDESESGELARQLIEYQAVKLAAEQLGFRDVRGIGAFARASEAVPIPLSNQPPKLAAHVPGSLVRALRRRLSALPSPKSIASVRPLVTLAMMIERILGVLRGEQEVGFSRVARACADNNEVKTAFLATLVLVRRRVIDAEQVRPFGEITLIRRPVAFPKRSNGPQTPVDE
jgi:segregation and condensation protein A